MKEKVFASIVVPTLNEEQFIERTLKALLNQSIAKDKYEVIVSDSNSSDATVAIAKRYADKVVVCKRHSAGFGRNFGAKHASAEYIGFVDADTIVSGNWVEGLIEGLQHGIACTGPIEALEKDSVKLRLFYRYWSLQSRLSVLINYPIFPGFNMGVRKREFEKVLGFSTKNFTTEDFELGLKLNQIGEIVFSEKMKVRTSTRKLREIPLPVYVWNGVRFALFGKSRPWEEHRRDF